jgi:hypothetical protein
MGSALLACLAIGVAGSAGAATLPFTGTLSLQLQSVVPALVVPGAGTAQLVDDGSFHLLSFGLAGGTFGPASLSVPLTNNSTLDSVRMTGVANLAGSFGGISGGPPGGGPMGLSGLAKFCGLGFATCNQNSVPMPLTPTAGGAGFGIGGTATSTGPVRITMRNAPWALGQPVVTLHTPGSTFSTPTLPGGFAHGPASLTSSTAQPSGALQLVTVTKVYSSLTGAFPEMELHGVLTLHFVPEPGTLVLLATGVAAFSFYGRGKRRR